MGIWHRICNNRQHPICRNDDPSYSRLSYRTRTICRFSANRSTMVGVISWSLLRGNGTLIGASANVVVAGIAKREGHAFSYGLLKNRFTINYCCTLVITCLYIFTLFNVKVVLHEIISSNTKGLQHPCCKPFHHQNIPIIAKPPKIIPPICPTIVGDN